MDANRWTRLSKYFEAALSMSRESRAAFLERVCADDQTLRADLESLLRASDASGVFLEQPLDSAPETSPASGLLPAGALLGHWRVLRVIGRGGMGEVYEAERAAGDFEQRAAVKLTRRESAAQLERFNEERQLLARLDHPGIARLLDGGVAPDGRPLPVSEYGVHGKTFKVRVQQVAAPLITMLECYSSAAGL